MLVWICTTTPTCMSTFMACACLSGWMQVQVHVHAGECWCKCVGFVFIQQLALMNACMHVCMCVCRCTYIHAKLLAHTSMQNYFIAHAHAHAHMHVHLHAQTSS